MAFAVVLKFLGGTLEQYDMLIAKMGFQPGEAGARHSLFHWAAALTDVWDSRRAFEQFAAEQIGPLAGEVGLPGPPEITFYEVQLPDGEVAVRRKSPDNCVRWQRPRPLRSRAEQNDSAGVIALAPSYACLTQSGAQLKDR